MEVVAVVEIKSEPLIITAWYFLLRTTYRYKVFKTVIKSVNVYVWHET
jgi:hypothetical protein